MVMGTGSEKIEMSKKTLNELAGNLKEAGYGLRGEEKVHIYCIDEELQCIGQYVGSIRYAGGKLLLEVNSEENSEEKSADIENLVTVVVRAALNSGLNLEISSEKKHENKMADVFNYSKHNPWW